MIWPAALLSIAALGVLAYHMVRPNYRDLRLSMARLMPDPPTSSAPKNRLSLTTPISSIRFWLRVMLLVAAALALGPRLWPERFAPPPEADNGGLRIVIDVSPSMALPSGSPTRLEAAVRLAEEALAEALAREPAPGCIDLVLAGRGSGTTLTGPSLAAHVEDLQPISDGRPASDILRALQASGSSLCAAPRHALIYTDQPAQPVPAAVFAGAALWQQLGEPVANVALASASMSGGGLGGTAARLDLRAMVYGDNPQRVTLRITGPGGVSDVALRPDGLGGGGWMGSMPVTDGGRYDVRLLDGGEFAADDRAFIDIAAPGVPALDWQLTTLPAPVWVEGMDRDDPILVSNADFSNALPAGRFLWTYPGWDQTTALQIGPFVDDHPALDTLNLDVFERAPPAPPARLPAGMEALLRPEGLPDTAWIAIRQNPPGIIVPAPLLAGTDDRAAMSRVIFFNALRWLSADAAQGELELDWRDAGGAVVVQPWRESETARPLGSRDDPMLVFDLAAPDPRAVDHDPGDNPFAAWLIALVSVLFALDRLIGANWSRLEARV